MATGSDVAQRIIARAIPTMTEEDSLLVLHGADLQAQASADPGKTLTLPGFPISVELRAEMVARATPQQLEVVLARRAAAAVYESGTAAFSAAGQHGTSQTGPMFSSAWTMHQALVFLNVRTHSRLGHSTLLLGLASAGLAVLLCLQMSGYARLGAVAGTVAASSVVTALISLFAWLITQINYSGSVSPLGSAAWAMLADVAWVAVAIDVVALVCGVLLLIGVYLLARLAPAHTGAAAADSIDAHTIRTAPRGRRALDGLPKPPSSSN